MMLMVWVQQILCRWGRHKEVLYRVGHNMGKECLYCKAPLPLTAEEIAQAFVSKKRDSSELVQEEEERSKCPWYKQIRRGSSGPGVYGS